MSKATEQASLVFIDFLRKQKGMYSQEEVEKIVQSNRQELVRSVRSYIENRQYSGDVLGGSFMDGYNKMGDDILNLEILQEGEHDQTN